MMVRSLEDLLAHWCTIESVHVPAVVVSTAHQRAKGP